MSPMDAYAQGLQKMLTSPPLTPEFVGMAGYAPASFHDLVDEDECGARLTYASTAAADPLKKISSDSFK